MIVIVILGICFIVKDSNRDIFIFLGKMWNDGIMVIFRFFLWFEVVIFVL